MATFVIIDGLQLSQVFSSTSATTPNVSGQVQAGDLIAFMDVARNNVGAPANVTPSGFTNILTFVEDARMSVHYKISAGNETTIAGMNGGVENQKMAYVFRGDHPITAVSPSTPTTQGTTGDPSPQTVSASGGLSPLIIFGCYRGSGAVGTRTFTVGGSAAKDGEINFNTNSYLAYKIYNQSPQDAVIDEGDNGDNMLASFYIACS
jgi:hypothetical protein